MVGQEKKETLIPWFNLDLNVGYSVQVFINFVNCRDEGGMLHIHGNVKDTEEDSWTNHIKQSISGIARSEGPSFLPFH